jgi:hypothetical protein
MAENALPARLFTAQKKTISLFWTHTYTTGYNSMKVRCPVCRNTADLSVSPFFKEASAPHEKNEWHITCRCGFKKDGGFSLLQHSVLILLFLLPIAAVWALFLVYADALSHELLRFALFVLHLFPGFLAGIYLSTRYGKTVILHMLTSRSK